MKIPKVLESEEGQWVVLGLVAVIVVYYVGKHVIAGATQAAGAAASAAGGVLSGNNSLTQGTPYQGAGILGTLGAATNTVSGGALQSAGESLGDWLYDTFNPSISSTAAPAANRDQVVTPNYVTDLSQVTGSWD